MAGTVIKDENGSILLFDPIEVPPFSNSPELRWKSLQTFNNSPIVLFGYSIGGIDIYLRYDIGSFGGMIPVKGFIDRPPDTVQGIRNIVSGSRNMPEIEEKLANITDNDVAKLQEFVAQGIPNTSKLFLQNGGQAVESTAALPNRK